MDLHVWTGDTLIGRISHDAKGDAWSLRYTDAWLVDNRAFPLSPALPLGRPEAGYASASISRFIAHLLPEGRALDVAASYNRVSPSNIAGLILALGAETAGALRFTSGAEPAGGTAEPVLREISLRELDERIAQREALPLTVWDGRVRMSVAGLQDKLAVYIDRPLSDGGRLWLVDGQRLASTHLLKPDANSPRTPHLAVNEHFCMSLARRMGLPAAEVSLLRTPRPVLVVRRFDRDMPSVAGQPRVERLHMIDACQACDLPVSHKYERNFGSAPEVCHIRDGVSFERLFGCTDLTANKASARLTLLRWALFQLLIGNSDAHGKNFSFFVRPGGLLEPAPWYDLVSVQQYAGFDNELAMAYGDAFAPSEVAGFPLADFASRCGIDRKLMKREGQRMAKAAALAARQQAAEPVDRDDERAFVTGLAAFVEQRAGQLSRWVADAAAMKDDYL